MIIKKGCDCEWCEAVSWDVVGELRNTCEKLQQSLMMREVDRAELEALLQVKIEVSTDLREKLRYATEETVDLRKQIYGQQEKIAHLGTRLLCPFCSLSLSFSDVFIVILVTFLKGDLLTFLSMFSLLQTCGWSCTMSRRRCRSSKSRS